MTTPAVEFRSVGVRYEHNGPPIITDTTFTVAAGERVALVGLNGSGKTTLLLAVAGLVPHTGVIEVCGTILSRKTLTEVRDRTGFLFNVPEDQLLFPKVFDDVSFGLVRRGVPPREAAEKASRALEATGVSHLAEAPLHHLSHGQKQRVALAGTLVTEPALLLLDEPSSALDPPGRRRLVDTLRSLSAAQLIATHDLSFAKSTCTRILLLETGRITRDMSAGEFPDDPWIA